MNWLKRYYGITLETLNPVIVEEGEVYAIVKLSKPSGRGTSGVGYVLINKFGTHALSDFKSLHEGMPTAEDMQRMKDELKKAEAK